MANQIKVGGVIEMANQIKVGGVIEMANQIKVGGVIEMANQIKVGGVCGSQKQSASSSAKHQILAKRLIFDNCFRIDG